MYIYNKTSIKRNILTTKKKKNQEVGRVKDLSAPWYFAMCFLWAQMKLCLCTHGETM
jgi:hypothetical protein